MIIPYIHVCKRGGEEYNNSNKKKKKRRRRKGYQNIEQEDGLLKEHIPGWTDSEDFVD